MKVVVKNRYLILVMGMITIVQAYFICGVYLRARFQHIFHGILLVLRCVVNYACRICYRNYYWDVCRISTPLHRSLAGSIFLGLGMILSSFTPQSSPWLIYVFYGIIGGFGVGCVYTTTVSVVQKWFPDKRGFATGMMVCAFGFSLVLFAPLTKMLLADWGVPKTFLLFGILFLVICSICSLLLNNPETKQQSNMPVSTQKQFTTKEIFDKEFFLTFFHVLPPAAYILNPLFISLMERGLTENLRL